MLNRKRRFLKSCACVASDSHLHTLEGASACAAGSRQCSRASRGPGGRQRPRRRPLSPGSAHQARCPRERGPQAGRAASARGPGLRLCGTKVAGEPCPAPARWDPASGGRRVRGCGHNWGRQFLLNSWKMLRCFRSLLLNLRAQVGNFPTPACTRLCASFFLMATWCFLIPLHKSLAIVPLTGI